MYKYLEIETKPTNEVEFDEKIYRCTGFSSIRENFVQNKIKEIEGRGEKCLCIKGGKYYYIFVEKIDEESNNTDKGSS